METPTIENQRHLDNADLIRRNALLEETLKEKEGMLDPGGCFIEKPFSVESLAGKVQEVLAKNSAAV